MSKLNKIDEISKDLDLLKSQSNNERCYTYANVAKRDVVALAKSQLRAELLLQSDSFTNAARNNAVDHGSLNPFLLRKQRRGRIFSQVSGTREKIRRVSPVKVPDVTGTASASAMKGFNSTDREERRHYFLSRVNSDVDINVSKEYCEEKNPTVLGCLGLPSKRKDMKYFYIVIPAAQSSIAEDPDTRSEDIFLRRYFSNEEAGTWLKSMN